MSARHFGQLPVLALQLAVEVERYRRAIRGAPADSANRRALEILKPAREMALALPTIWPEWGRLMLAHAEWARAALAASPEVPMRRALGGIETSAEHVARKLLYWSVFEQDVHPLPIVVADAFLMWEGARRAASHLREEVGNVPDDEELARVCRETQAEADRLLLEALGTLETGRRAA